MSIKVKTLAECEGHKAIIRVLIRGRHNLAAINSNHYSVIEDDDDEVLINITFKRHWRQHDDERIQTELSHRYLQDVDLDDFKIIWKDSSY
jgi:hypothetical protein